MCGAFHLTCHNAVVTDLLPFLSREENARAEPILSEETRQAIRRGARSGQENPESLPG